jgi:hypothetical protein
VVTVLGLVCALVGAVALGSGLLVYSQPASDRGFQRSPTEYAHGAPFAVIGATLLAVGFFLIRFWTQELATPDTATTETDI